MKMFNVTSQVVAMVKNPSSGIEFVTLNNGSEWVVVKNHPATPAGMETIMGVNNGSYRFINRAEMN